jgi:membrane protein YqaA with SNARE-associated domain
LSYISYALGRILSARGLLMKRGLGYQDFKEEEVKQTYQLGVWGLVFQSLKLLK